MPPASAPLLLLPAPTAPLAESEAGGLEYHVRLGQSSGSAQAQAEEASEVVFEGSLSDLAAALRSGALAAPQIPLLELTLAVLRWLHAHPAWQSGPPPAEVLPPLAAVIALKARLLLPPAEAEAALAADDLDDWPEPWDEVSEGVEALAELGRAVEFLSQRRAERSGLIPAPVPKPGLELPRRVRTPKRGQTQQGQNLRRLLEAARAAVREVDVPLLARERLSLQGAMTALLAFGRRLRHFSFGSVTVQDWGERTTYFAALLEAVKTGELRAEQAEAYGEIQVELGEVRGGSAEVNMTDAAFSRGQRVKG